MADYIERESVMAILEDHPAGSWRGHDVYTDEVRAIMREVEELPATDVAPVRRGRWATKGGTCTCSVCGSAAIDREEDHGGFDHLLTRYCPNCGAKMDAGGQNAD